ncbi:hypothetical protein MA16_Dca025557 [Dendrobium catenatum]|uniref:Retrotransposon gag domain-containing protein n=1 Tax=Dendrobium catenatum TaxID=906689 RepID=A0A2I0WRH1_9ASPA|nr:hypothetical protein MA16_Dca025557 [Dendrobium catenatum]
MDPQHLQATLDLILGQLGTVTQQICNTQTDLADFRRHTSDRLDNIERNGNPAIYTPSRPHSPYGDDNRPDREQPRDPGHFQDHYRPNHRPHQEPVEHDNPWRDNDAQLLKNIRIDAPTYDGTLDPQVFLDWLKSMDSYFKWYNISEVKKVRFAEMKLTGRANLYWTNLENMRESRGEHPISDWRTMKQELRKKYLPPSYYPKLLDKWNRLTQGSKSVKDYISAINDFLIRCNGEESATPTQILSMFRDGLREDLRTELFARGIDTLEAACSLVLDPTRIALPPASLKIDPHTRPVADPLLAQPLSVPTLRVKHLNETPQNPILEPNVIGVMGMGTLPHNVLAPIRSP